MIATMRDRMTAKMGNANDNAFRMRQLFRAGDAAGTGLVRVLVRLCVCALVHVRCAFWSMLLSFLKMHAHPPPPQNLDTDPL
jgi:hypothetical protein